jgi:hypothetical protein
VEGGVVAKQLRPRGVEVEALVAHLWRRCYDHNFLPFFYNFGRKNWRFFKTNIIYILKNKLFSELKKIITSVLGVIVMITIL